MQHTCNLMKSFFIKVDLWRNLILVCVEYITHAYENWDESFMPHLKVLNNNNLTQQTSKLHLLCIISLYFLYLEAKVWNSLKMSHPPSPFAHLSTCTKSKQGGWLVILYLLLSFWWDQASWILILRKMEMKCFF